jgi:hypothetical protein
VFSRVQSGVQTWVATLAYNNPNMSKLYHFTVLAMTRFLVDIFIFESASKVKFTPYPTEH